MYVKPIFAGFYLQNGNYDIAILDIMMPKMDGITLLRRLRTTGITIPIIMLTAKAEIDDKVLGLDSGANDYLTKPFDTKELLARIRVLTRGQRPVDSTIQFGNISLDRTTFALSSASGSFRLANKEFQMMEILMSNPKILVSSEQFMEKIWGYDANAEINVVWVYISIMIIYVERHSVVFWSFIYLLLSNVCSCLLPPKKKKKF